MAITVHRAPQRRPSFSEQLGGAFSRAAQGASEFGLQEYQKNLEDQRAKELGLDISSYRDPQLRYELLREANLRNIQLKRAKDLANLRGQRVTKEEEEEEIPYSKQPLPELYKGKYRPERTEIEEKLPEETKPKKRKRLKEGIEPSFRQPLPEVYKGKYRPERTEPISEFFPNNVGPQEAPGNFPQPETEGIKRPLLTPEQKLNRASELTNKYINAGIPITQEEALGLVNTEEAQNEAYNRQVEADIEQRRQAQTVYGQKARGALQKLMPEATDEMLAYFAKKGEEIAPRSKSEADIDRYLATEAKKFKNTLANVRDSLPAPRLMQKVKANVLGYDRDFDKVKSDIRIKLKPLLDAGLYDTARNTLSELGYHPEERESIISDLHEFPKKILADMPNIKKREEGISTFGRPFPEENYSTEDQERVGQALSHVFASDPAVNLVLLRKAFEEKGVDWQLFKDKLNELIESGEVNLNDDQFQSLNVIDQPPLNKLEKILHGMKLIGR